MIRTSKKDIEREIRSGRYNEIETLEKLQQCGNYCRYIAYSRDAKGFTGLVLCDSWGNMHATTSRTILEEYF